MVIANAVLGIPRCKRELFGVIEGFIPKEKYDLLLDELLDYFIEVEYDVFKGIIVKPIFNLQNIKNQFFYWLQRLENSAR